MDKHGVWISMVCPLTLLCTHTLFTSGTIAPSHIWTHTMLRGWTRETMTPCPPGQERPLRGIWGRETDKMHWHLVVWDQVCSMRRVRTRNWVRHSRGGGGGREREHPIRTWTLSRWVCRQTCSASNIGWNCLCDKYSWTSVSVYCVHVHVHRVLSRLKVWRISKVTQCASGFPWQHQERKSKQGSKTFSAHMWMRMKSMCTRTKSDKCVKVI